MSTSNVSKLKIAILCGCIFLLIGILLTVIRALGELGFQIPFPQQIPIPATGIRVAPQILSYALILVGIVLTRIGYKKLKKNYPDSMKGVGEKYLLSLIFFMIGFPCYLGLNLLNKKTGAWGVLILNGIPIPVTYAFLFFAIGGIFLFVFATVTFIKKIQHIKLN